MPRAYYGSKISENMTELSDGCLACFNVPIARTGTYKYLRQELGLDGDGIVDVYRTEDQVFNETAIASFEGKAFTDTHPAVDVDVNLYKADERVLSTLESLPSSLEEAKALASDSLFVEQHMPYLLRDAYFNK